MNSALDINQICVGSTRTICPDRGKRINGLQWAAKMSSNGGPSPANFVPREDLENVSKKLKECEAEKLQIIKDQGNMMKEFNRRMHVHLEEIRLLKDVNQKLQGDVQELRDLCCYLDDDRQKCRKLAREWQRFGRYTASVMRNEVTSYQEKLQSLEEKQSELTKDNVELKELCLYLERQRESTVTRPSNIVNTAVCSESSREPGGHHVGVSKGI